MLPTNHPLSFRKTGLALAQVAIDLLWKFWHLFRARPLLPIGLILLWGGLFVSWKVKALVVPGQFIWVTGFIMWTIGMRSRKR